jgi:hypothetical protein
VTGFRERQFTVHNTGDGDDTAPEPLEFTRASE